MQTLRPGPAPAALTSSSFLALPVTNTTLRRAGAAMLSARTAPARPAANQRPRHRRAPQRSTNGERARPAASSQWGGHPSAPGRRELPAREARAGGGAGCLGNLLPSRPWPLVTAPAFGARAAFPEAESAVAGESGRGLCSKLCCCSASDLWRVSALCVIRFPVSERSGSVVAGLLLVVPLTARAVPWERLCSGQPQYRVT